MITEDEAFWAGIAVATVMLGVGFSVLFIRTYTGFGAVILSMGLMTLTSTIHLRAMHNERIESPREIAKTQLISEFLQSEAKTDQPPSEMLHESTQTPAEQEPTEHIEPTEQVEANQRETTEEDKPSELGESGEPSQPAEPISTELDQPSEPEASEPPEIEEKTSEEPQVVTATN